MKIVIVGAGMAGSAMVDELLELDRSLDIHLFGKEKFLPYNRIYITDVLSGNKLPSQIILKSYQRYEEEDIKLHIGKKIERIFPDTKKFVTSEGSMYSYDKLILATGSEPYLPPVDGLNKRGIFSFRSLDDVYKILDLARVSKTAAVVGGGLLGLECAKALRDIGLDVSIIHISDTLMERQLDKTSSQMLKKRFESMGIRVLLNTEVIEVIGGRKVEGLRFSDGRLINTDLVVFATGVKPNVSIALQSNLAVNRGILVNEFLETSKQDIYGVGECIEYRGQVYGLVGPTMEQVKICARNVVFGNVEKYAGSLEYAMLKVAGVKLMSIGDINEKDTDEITLYKDKENYRKAIIRDGRLSGAIIYGNLSGSENIIKMIKNAEIVEDSSFLIRNLITEEKRELKEEDVICNCNMVYYKDILKAIKNGAKSIDDLQKTTKASTSCGSCASILEDILKKFVKEKPKAVNKVEEYKKTKHPFETNLFKNLELWAMNGDWQDIPEEDRDIGLKWYGIFYRKATPGYFMIRIRITHGKLSSEQAIILSKLSKKFGRGEIDITSRQQIQLRWIELKNLPEVLLALNVIGLTTLQTGMDNVRNITGDPLSSLVEDNVIDTIPIAKRMAEVFIGKKQYADLPRKFNLAILGSKRDTINCKYNDLCFYLAKRDNMIGFNVYAGGKIGSGGPEEALDLDIFVKPYDAVDITKAMLDLYTDMGNRIDRNKNRLFFLIKELGKDFRTELEKRLLKNLYTKGEDLVESTGERYGIIKQKNGLYSVSLIIPAGMFTAEDLEVVAYLARRYGSGDIRFSVYQNLYIVNVPEENLKELLNNEIFEKYPISSSAYLEGLMACQGSKTCAFGVIQNKPDAIRLVKDLSDSLPLENQIRMHWSGCAKGCGQHGAGDIGFVGTKIKVNGEVKLAVDVWIKDKKINTVPLDNLDEFVKNILKENFSC